MTMLALAAAICCSAPRAIPAPAAPKADMLVGVYYFPGWSQADRWYCILANPAVQHPLLGYYREGDPEVADWHIQWAVEHGVGFFAFDYYTHNGSQMLESAIEGFKRSRFADRMKFCINWCNHAPASTMTAEHLAEFAELVIPKYLTHPSYLRLDGKPVVFILSGYSFVKTLGVDGARRAFEAFDASCRAAGLPGVHIMSCEGEIVGEQALKDALAAGIRGFALYNYPYAGTDMKGPGRYMEATYAHMTEQGERIWKHWGAVTGGRFWPTVMPGWDRRPWLRDKDLVRTGSTPDLFRDALTRARQHVNGDRVVMVEAWNEWGEGSILEPSVEHGFAYLDALRSVFCPRAGRHRDLTPRDLGRPAPVFDLKLPSVSHWLFDFGLEGWTGKGVANLRADHGAMHFTTSNADPQVSSPANYIECARYPRLRIRMKAAPPEGAPQTVPAQVFWSTVEYAMREDTSQSFTLKADDRWHVYEVNLSQSPKWKGMADGLRLDPGDRAGLNITVDEVLFLPDA